MGQSSGLAIFRAAICFAELHCLPATTTSCPRKEAPLAPDQVKLIELWIGTGASGTLAADAIKDAPAGSAFSPALADVTFEEIDTAAVTRLRAGIAPSVSQLQKRYRTFCNTNHEALPT